MCVCRGVGVYEGGEEIIVCMQGCRGCMKGVRRYLCVCGGVGV